MQGDSFKPVDMFFFIFILFIFLKNHFVNCAYFCLKRNVHMAGSSTLSIKMLAKLVSVRCFLWLLITCNYLLGSRSLIPLAGGCGIVPELPSINSPVQCRITMLFKINKALMESVSLAGQQVESLAKALLVPRTWPSEGWITISLFLLISWIHIVHLELVKWLQSIQSLAKHQFFVICLLSHSLAVFHGVSYQPHLP